MRRLASLLIFAMFALHRPLFAQTVHYGVVSDSIREVLADAWRVDSTQVERAYCVRRVRISPHRISATAVDSIFRVIAVEPAAVRTADPNHVDFACAPGTPELHTHTPATCLSDDVHFCVAEGPLAYSCQPSRDDYEKLLRRGDPFGVVQCDRKAFRFYYPSEYVRLLESQPAGAAKPSSSAPPAERPRWERAPEDEPGR